MYLTGLKEFPKALDNQEYRNNSKDSDTYTPQLCDYNEKK